MKNLQWYKTDIYLMDSLERFFTSRFQDKLLIIKANLKNNGLEARIKSFIINIKNNSAEYFNDEYYIGIGEKLFEKIYKEIESKKIEIKRILENNIMLK